MKKRKLHKVADMKKTIKERIYLFDFESLLVGAWRSRWNCGRINIHSLRFRHLSSLIYARLCILASLPCSLAFTIQDVYLGVQKIAEGRVYLLTCDHVFVFLFYLSQYSLEDRRKYGCHNLFLAWKCQTSECLFVVFTRDMESGCSCRYLFPNATAEKVYVQTFARKNSSNWLCVWILGRFSFGRWTTKV